ncbi:hypothetical protein [Aeromonas veronii]|uniref:hypothetical protein n=1 Tax=Aeromonas veronii TaxID=654 RepID=UPI002415EAA0|nr:hypothetical protein [Aeromonas veronii]WFO49763.1 hypothetical protein L1O00_12015 [Aeromonas veronii]
MAENGPIEELAKIISNKIFDRFHWKRVGPCDQDFPCEKESLHKPEGKKQDHTHPVDTVFCYKDPYLNKVIYLNTDLKSYKKGSIQPKNIEAALNSLANTIDCARHSPLWETKYATEVGHSEVRGLLFVYNHDNNFEHNFYEYFFPEKLAGAKRKPPAVNMDKIKIQPNQQIHIIEPDTICYLISMISDINEMIAESTFPRGKEYGFYYPQLTYHKVLVNEKFLPATVELLTAPFLIIKHGAVLEHSREVGDYVEKYPDGYIIYYNRPGDSDLEFLYLFDILSSYQILNLENNIRIRVAAKKRSDSIRSNFNRALEKFSHEWDFDDISKQKLHKMQLHLVPIAKEFYSTEEISWDY